MGTKFKSLTRSEERQLRDAAEAERRIAALQAGKGRLTPSMRTVCKCILADLKVYQTEDANHLTPELVGQHIMDLEIVLMAGPSRRCESCGMALDSTWGKATVHVDRETGVTCGGRIS